MRRTHRYLAGWGITASLPLAHPCLSAHHSKVPGPTTWRRLTSLKIPFKLMSLICIVPGGCWGPDTWHILLQSFSAWINLPGRLRDEAMRAREQRELVQRFAAPEPGRWFSLVKHFAVAAAGFVFVLFLAYIFTFWVFLFVWFLLFCFILF